MTAFLSSRIWAARSAVSLKRASCCLFIGALRIEIRRHAAHRRDHHIDGRAEFEETAGEEPSGLRRPHEVGAILLFVGTGEEGIELRGLYVERRIASCAVDGVADLRRPVEPHTMR